MPAPQREIAGTATVTVEHVNPAEGKRWPSIKTNEGVYYSLPKSLVGKFAVGQEYTISYSQRDWEGKTYYTAENIIGGSPAQRPGQPAPKPTALRKDPQEQKQIFITALAKEWIKGIPIGDTAAVVHMLKSLSSAYEQVFGALQRNEDLDDEIPY